MSTFYDGFVVLAIGLAIGTLIAWRVRRQARPDIKARDADAELRFADLEARKKSLYDQLSTADESGLEAGDRRRLERSAARVLRDLKATGAEIRARPAKKDNSSHTAPQAATASRRAGLLGFVYGGGMVALVVALFLWAGRDATPRPPDVSTPTPQAAAADRTLPPEVAARVRTLEARLESDPRDLQTRKALTELLIAEGSLFEGFQQSELVLKQSPEDADGLYFQGMVQLMMGQSESAIELLDRALVQIPEHVSALLVRGLAMLRLGRNEEAIVDWERGLEASGGSHAGLQRLLEMARDGKGTEEILGTPPQTETRGGMPAATAGSPTSDVSFDVSVVLPEGASAPPNAVLFVFYRGAPTDPGAPGPPAAVRRIDNPQFPIDLTIDQGDSMLGRPLPEAGTLSARLDGDGSASTNDPGDLSAQVQVRDGDTVTLQLE